MLAEEYTNSASVPSLSNQEGKTISYIYECLKNASIPFKKASSQPNLVLPLNENKYTQIFVEQVEVFVKSHPNIGVKNQYSDTFFNTKGIPDFYFHKVEEGVHNLPLIVFEVKILTTSFPKEREKEYVIGAKGNGGIERFKSEKHGFGLSQCGLVGFIVEEDSVYWLKAINEWIETLATAQNDWHKDEILNGLEKAPGFNWLQSIAHRKSNDLELHHIWIAIN